MVSLVTWQFGELRDDSTKILRGESIPLQQILDSLIEISSNFLEVTLFSGSSQAGEEPRNEVIITILILAICIMHECTAQVTMPMITS